jgi:hypothetical protein
MIHELIILLAVSGWQDAKVRPKSADDDDEIVAGLPVGDVRPLPERVKWRIADRIAEKTSTRERVDLSGFWRFAAVDEQETPVKREEMGWIELPGLPAADGDNVFDPRFRDSDGLWRGKPLEKYPFVWIERDIQITNADTLEWLNRRIYLILAGPWVDAELFASQRIVKRPTEQTDNSSVHVHVESVKGVERDGARWCDITEQLIYPGTTQISLRLRRAKPTSDAESASEPNISLERWPTGCRIDSIHLQRDAKLSAIKATLNLERPEGYMILGMPPVRTIPLSLNVWIESHDSNMELASTKKDIAPLDKPKRAETVDIPWSPPKDGPQATRVRLRAQLTMTNGVVFDDAFPIEFRPTELEVADE